MGQPTYLLTDLAESDIQEAIAYIQSRSPRAAAMVRSRLREEMRRLAEFSNIGHMRPDVTTENVRF